MPRKTLQFIKNYWRYGLYAGMFIGFIVSFIYQAAPILAQANNEPGAIDVFLDPKLIVPIILGIVLLTLIQAVGTVLTTISTIFAQVILYNNFIYSSIVISGWEVVRDVSNMFFILILLFIAIATIFNQETYSLRRALPRLVIMAILINFSKVIAGLIIDFAQILTLTFATVVTRTGIQGIYISFGIQDFLTYSDLFKNTSVGNMDVVAGLFVGLLLLLIVTIILSVYTIIFLFRITALWILIVLSPLAYLLRAWPGGKAQGYANEWWNRFTQYVFVGPIIMFFFWLALTATGQDLGLNMAIGNQSFGLSRIFEPVRMTRFLVSSCLLVGGLIAAAQSGVKGSDIAKRWADRIKRVPGQVARMGPYNYVSDRLKNYMAFRRSARADRARESSLELMRTVGRGKQIVGGAVSDLLGSPARLAGRLPFLRSGQLAQEAIRQKEEARAKIRTIQNNLNYKEGEVEGKVGNENVTFRFDKLTNKWRDSVGETSDALVKDATDRRLAELRKIASEKEAKARQYATRQRWTNTGLATAAAATALTPFGTVALAGLGSNLLNSRKIRNWGAEEVKRARNYKVQEVSKRQDELKSESDDVVRQKMNDLSLDAMDRMAAIFEALKRNILGLDEIIEQRDHVKALSNDDPRIMSRFEGALRPSNVAAETDVREYMDASIEPKRKEELRSTLVGRIRDRTYDPSRFDSGSLEQLASIIAQGMRLSKAQDLYKGLGENSRKAFMRGLEKAIQIDPADIKSRAVLGAIGDIEKAYGKFRAEETPYGQVVAFQDQNGASSVVARKAFTSHVSDLSVEDLQDIVSGKNPKRLSTFKAALNGDETHFSSGVKDFLNSGQTKSKNLRKGLGLGGEPLTPGEEADEAEGES